MAKSKEQKQSILTGIKDELQGMKSAIFVNFFGIKVKEINELRRKCREEKVNYVVTKKTLLKKALAERGLEGIDQSGLSGEVAAVFGQADEVAPAKIISEFAKKHEQMKVIGGVLEGKLIDAAMVKSLASLPSKQELLAKMVGSISSPLSGFVNVLQGNLRGLVQVLNAIKDKKV